MSKKSKLFIICSISLVAILISICIIFFIKKLGDTAINNETEIDRKIAELCNASEYKKYGSTIFDVLNPNNYYPEYDEFLSSEDEKWSCTRNSICKENIGERIGTITSSRSKKDYEVYEIKNISSKYAIAFYEMVLECYMTLICTEYYPSNLQEYISDTNLTNSDVEIYMYYSETQALDKESAKCGRVLFSDEDKYLWNDFFRENRYIGFSERNDEYIAMSIYIYQKTLDDYFEVRLQQDGTIHIYQLNTFFPYVFEGKTDDLIQFIDYVAQHYEGYKEDSIK